MLDADFFRRWMTVTAASVDREAERLTALDSPIGDADHGSNLQRGFRAVRDALDKEPPATAGAVLVQAGRLLISTVGGASGPLYGTLLRRTGKALGDSFAAARDAAEEGAVATTPLRARKGRASYLGERSIGHQDPGATSAALLIAALVDAEAGGE